MKTARLAQTLWSWRCRPAERAFVRALDDPLAAQSARLRALLARNAGTAYGKAHGFAGVADLATYAERVPLVTAHDLVPAIDRIAAGEPNVLTAEPVTHLIPTSGSSAARKLIPHTASFQRECQASIGPWVRDLFTRHPAVRGGPAYWSVSPCADDDAARGGVRIGFDDDTAYLGGWARRLVSSTLAVPPAVRRCADIDVFRFATLRFLLAAPELRFVSVWHPTFWTLLLDALETSWDALITEVAHGTCTAAPALAKHFRPDRARADALGRATPREPRTVWPHLTCISAWADAAAAVPFAELERRSPGIAVEAKGLVATEGLTSIPWRGAFPAAVTGHVIELLDDGGTAPALDRVDVGGMYEVVLTTGAGLYRYRTDDRVEVTGRVGRTPTLRFTGRGADVSDVAGEKLHAAHVDAAVAEVCAALHVAPTFVLVAPASAAAPTHYVVCMHAESGLPPALGTALDRAFAANPHYRHCRALGQLGPPELLPVGRDAARRVLEHDHRAGRRLGDIKPRTLRADAGWASRLGVGDPAAK